MSLYLAQRRAEQRVRAAYATADYCSEKWGREPFSVGRREAFEASVDELDAALAVAAEFEVAEGILSR